jgi:hypothetical protein|tara:strand:- start:669 stop:1250 length:582 start_codon:yes stop_codon:yes gene_type:complete
MANRVLLGKRGSDFGLFISQNTVDVTDTSVTTPLAFDSRAVRGIAIHAKGEGSLAPNSGNNASAIDIPTTATITHNLGYIPLYTVRWCYASNLSSGVATKMFTPSYRRFEDGNFDFADDEEESDWREIQTGGVSTGASTSTITINNHEYGYSVEVGNDDAGSAPNEEFGTNKQTIYYAYIIFKAKDFTGGLGL